MKDDDDDDNDNNDNNNDNDMKEKADHDDAVLEFYITSLQKVVLFHCSFC